MTSPWLTFYHHLPAPARSAAATVRGWCLNRWRDGAEKTELVRAALERDRWSADQWAAWREARLGALLHRAATRVPYYRKLWETRRRAGDRRSWERLEHWPLLEKDAVRSNPRAFLADDCDPRAMCREQTSGTTGTPLTLWRSRATVAGLYALATARTRAWDGIPAGVRWARLGGQLVTPVNQRRPPFWVWNAAMRQLYLSSYHLAPDLMPHYLEALVRYRVEYIAGYPSGIAALARQALRDGRCDVRLTAVYSNAEPLTAEQRRTISAAFDCPVRQTYGMAETVAAASECAAQPALLHLWPEVGIVEDGEGGELICTGLLNPDMLLIRYRVGDRGRLGGPGRRGEACACGRALPVISAIEGRTDDVLVTRDGRRAGPLDLVFDGLDAIREAQIVQEQLDLIRVLVAATPEFTSDHERSITLNVRSRLGEVQVIVDRVEAVPRTANGKLRAVVCNVPRAHRFEEAPT